MIKKASIFICSVLLVSCNELSQSIKETVNPSAQTVEQQVLEQQPKPVGPIAASVDRLRQAEHSLRELPRFKGREIVVHRSAHFYEDGRIILNIQDPSNPGNIDQYTYKNDEWQNPVPVRIIRSDKLEEHLASLDKAPFERANKVHNIIRQKLKEINSDQIHMTVYFVPYKGSVRWYPRNLKTERSRYSLAFDEEANLLSFEQD